MGLSGAWRISASDFDTITSRAGVTHTDALRALLPQARTLSVAPISNFNVGAAVLGASGNVYLGANNEHTRVSIAACVHAEQCALANTFLGHEEAVRAIAITAMPCGHCRQFINELPNAKDITILVDNHDPLKFEALLPHSFGPSDLHADPIHFLSHPRTPLRVLAAPTVVPGSGKDADAAVAPKAAVESAVAAAEASYSPHTLSHAGLVLVIGDKHVRGSYVENCAFNPSLPPLQMALINARMQQLDCRAAEAVVLAEREHEVAVSHVDATLALMRSVGIRAPLTHVQLQCRGDGESGHARQRDCDGADGDKSEESRSPGTTSDEGPSRGEEGDQTQG
ncbi:cytidine deaminase [Salpingoeca rosetta]|uniref:Cytidine deaminase n=1 Tax=Salpingoeca rosetta (strain ATCC 50818 / BSB-021) TaxID=946362 RepID=F2TVB1_SALR5|nr:cytidine deaminase [Salpingoeca rosetta]EGD72007.1 cytidine deaminase [Salpingoeca rosetta]|eukprot:XP_004998579.1 cytidine deaminase [Salpingoeca rosetta]